MESPESLLRPLVKSNDNGTRNGGEKKDEVCMTWKDVWVRVCNKDNLPILQGVSGFAEPGNVLAILGPSGCGKSTLLDTLAGRLSSKVDQTGEILINGRKETLAFGTSAYVTQDDVLMTTLTVKETVYYTAQLQLPNSMPISEKKERAETTIKEMGLQDAMDTRIGGWNFKGISGGQKRRVSICNEILTRPRLLFLDEPTSGLDSAASFHVMSYIVKLASTDRTTIITSIHQPSSEVFELFSYLCLLSSGRTVYFGPVSTASEFFASAGFPCPTMTNPSDHFLKTINKDFDDEENIEEGDGMYTTEEAINILVNSYKTSAINQQIEYRVNLLSQGTGIPLEREGGKANFITQCIVLTKRSFINMNRDLGYYWFRLMIHSMICACLATVFFDLDHSYESIQSRGSLIMFVATFLAFMAIGGFPSFVEDMKVFGRERLNGKYGVLAFVIGNTCSSIPYLMINSLIPSLIIYYLVGLHKGFDHFFYFAFVLFIHTMLVESLMMVVASIVPDFLMGIITGSGIQGISVLAGGFFRLPDDLPKPVWKYPLYYASFHRYAYQGFFKNEFAGLTFENYPPTVAEGGPPTISGHQILKDRWQVGSESKWVDLVILVLMVAVCRLVFFGFIKAGERLR